jgi:hypothetical protein
MHLTLPSGSTLGTLLHVLTERYGEAFQELLLPDGELAPHALVTINGEYARQVGGANAILEEPGGTQVEIVLLGPPPMGG